MAVTKEQFKAAVRQGAPADGPFDVDPSVREKALKELAAEVKAKKTEKAGT